MKLDDVDGEGFQIEDRRGQPSAGGGGLGGLPIGKGGKIGIPALVIIVVITLLTRGGGGGGGGAGGLDEILGQLDGQTAATQPAPANTDGTRDAQYQFVGDVGSLLEDFWGATFRDSGEDFTKASLVIFDAPTDTGGCGVGQPEAGPFYCPPSKKIFIDFGFYQQLEQQLGFDGDFAMAYVLAHEYGHHIQNLLGIDDSVRQAQDGASESEANRLSVKMELQADCFAGIWAKSAYSDGRLENGDFDEAIDAAAAVGDDAIQRKTQGSVDRESFTHGSSADRKRWFKTGFDAASVDACDTFA